MLAWFSMLKYYMTSTQPLSEEERSSYAQLFDCLL